MVVNIDNVPEEILREIYTYIPYKNRALHTKTNYIFYNSKFIKNKIGFNINSNYSINWAQYIRRIIRNDFNFIFNILIYHEFNNWLNLKCYYYDNAVYRNFTEFINTYAIRNDAIKCRNILLKYFDINGLSKNRHKKIHYKNIRHR